MQSPEAIIYLVDDDPPVLKALRRLLTVAGYSVKTYDCPQHFLEQHDPQDHGCVVLDLSMPQLTGLDLQRELTARGSSLPIIFLTGRGDIPSSVQAMRAGAIDFLTKPVNDDDLLDAVGRAFAQSLAARQSQMEMEQASQCLAQLTPREREVLHHLIAGKLNKQIAADLGTVEKTIKVHRARVLQKMQVTSIAELVRVSLLLGIEPAQS
ncbi:MAG: response regulator transcription factor [Phycisphaeraceae bacterium]|nr:response regulator transcription factor [Phycisphaeraceae bacterium]